MIADDVVASEHACNCTCDTCMTEDCEAILAVHPKSTWSRAKLEWIRGVRVKPLNWTLPSRHCALCGGTDLSAWNMGEHWVTRNHNPVQIGNIIYTSVLVADSGSWYTTYQAVTKLGKEALKRWTLSMVGASRLEKVFEEPSPLCNYNMHETTTITGIAVRRLQDWTEIRIGVTLG